MLRQHLPFAPIIMAGLLGACATTDGDYPSLAIRDAERISGSGQPTEAAPALPPAAPLSAEAETRIGRAMARARAAHQAFSAGTPTANRDVAAARGAHSPADTWIAAQVALANLVTLRSETVISQADLDLMFAEDRLSDPGRITPTAEALAQARGAVEELVDEQNRTIARLASQLRN